jgi:O-methyltransferase
MSELIKSTVRSLINRLGFDIVQYESRDLYPTDFSDLSKKICSTVAPYTMTTPIRVNALVEAVRYVVNNKIEGAMVECGVWKGGSAMAMALALKSMGDEERDFFLYDTFSGMTAPKDVDVSFNGKAASDDFSKMKTSDDTSKWCLSPLDEVKNNLSGIDYPLEKIHFIEGKVEETIPKIVPQKIAILRLDTDWYESTKHELIHLFPLLQKNGVLIIDDYGHWQGARKAVDEYIAENNICLLLNRLDYTGRICVKA